MNPFPNLRLRLVLGSLIGLLVASCVGCAGGTPPFAGRYPHGAIAADHEIASQAGAQMLRLGGNAVDAAVSTSFTLSVVRPESCGIGGGGFMIIHFSEEGIRDQKARGREVPRDVALNYREMCPWGVGQDFYEKDADPNASTHGGKSVGIPGTVAGLLTALEKYGTLDRATVLAPAIRAAEEGFRADQHFVDSALDVAKDFEKNPAWKERFRFVWVRMCREGKIKVGDVIKLPEQAAALKLIAEQGVAAFYQGPIAQAMIAAVQRDAGVLSQEDLNRFQVASMEPLRFEAFGKTFVTMPPPSSGGVAMAEAIGILARIERKSAHSLLKPAGSMRGPASTDYNDRVWYSVAPYVPETVHALIESLKHAFADRSQWLGDPAFSEVPTQRLLSASYLDERAATFNPDRTLTSADYGSLDRRTALADDHGTSHLCVIDASGSAVSCTETINQGFGSCLAVDTFGFILNDQMDDFTTHRGKANAFGLRQSDRNLPAPGKRPLSSMSPTIALNADGRVDAIAGASGGPRIITGTMQVLINTTALAMPAWAAVTASRVHHQWSPDVVKVEAELYDSEVARTKDSSGRNFIDILQSRGHRVERTDAVGNVQLIARDPHGGWQAACDPRKGGKPAGY